MRHWLQTNTECLEGLFDTWGTFGRGFLDNLEQGGPPPIGAQKANIVSPRTLAFLQEIALNEQVRGSQHNRSNCHHVSVEGDTEAGLQKETLLHGMPAHALSSFLGILTASSRKRHQ